MTQPQRAPTVAGYRIRRRLRCGSMGTLWEAFDPKGRHVALKVADRGPRMDPVVFLRHFRREAASAVQFEHENLVRGYAVGESDDGRPFLALEYLQGETLLARLRRLPMREEEAVHVGVSLARALEYMHAHGVVHRDVKPENVMLLEGGGIKLVDLGLAEEAGRDAPGCGTPGYASPEMILQESVGPASDLFAVGITLTESVLGRRAFEGASVRSILRKTLREELVLPSRVHDRQLSEGFRRVVERLVAKAPEARYGSAAELRLDLEALETGDRPFGAWLAHRSRRPGLKVPLVVAAGLAVVVLGCAWLLLPEKSHPTVARSPDPPPDAPSPLADHEPDLQVEAALLYAEQNPDAPQEALRLLEAAQDRQMPTLQRSRFEEARREITERLDQMARDTLSKREQEARALRDVGDLEGMDRVLSTWPDGLAQTDEAHRAKALAAAWRREAEEPGRALIAEAERMLAPDDGSPLPAVDQVDDLLARVEALRAASSLPKEQRPRLDDLAGRLEAERRAAERRARETEAMGALRRALAVAPADRQEALRAIVEDPETCESEVARLVEAVLSSAARIERRLGRQSGVLLGVPWAGLVDGKLLVGRPAHEFAPASVFVPDYTVWDESDPWHRDASPLSARVDQAPGLSAWLWLHGIEIHTAPSADPRDAWTRLWAAMPDARHRNVQTSQPTPFWQDLRARLALALREPGTVGAQPNESTDRVLQAWVAATKQPLARPRSKEPPVALREARAAFLEDDHVRTWQTLQSAIAVAPRDGEAALLSSLVLEKLSRPLPQRAVLLLAFTEARRAWDLDPALSAAPRQVARLALTLLEDATETLRVRLEPVAAAACKETVRLGQAEPEEALFLAAWLDERGAHSEVLRLLRRAAEQWPSDPRVLLALGSSEAERGDARRAVEALEQAQTFLGRRFPDWASSLLQRLRD